jgi:WD40 repeat protein
MHRLAALAVLLALAGQDPKPAAEEPLPAGAVARLGSSRLRHGGVVTGVSFSRDGSVLSSGSLDHLVMSWDVASGKRLHVLDGKLGHVHAVRSAPDGKRLAAGYERGLLLWDPSDKDHAAVRLGETETTALDFSPSGWVLAAGQRDGTVILFNVSTREEIRRLEAHRGAVHSLAFSPNGSRLATAGRDAVVRFWDVSKGKELYKGEGHQKEIFSVAFSPDGKEAATAGHDGTIRLWDASTGKPAKIVAEKQGLPYSALFSPDGTELAWSAAGRIHLGNVNEDRPPRDLEGYSGSSVCLAFSSDGKRIASGGQDGLVRLWDRATGAALFPPSGHDNAVTRVSLSGDGTTVASVGRDSTIRIWEVSRGAERLKISAPSVHCIGISWDGKTLASEGTDSKIRFWETASGQEQGSLEGSPVGSFAFTPDGDRLITVDQQGQLHCWDLKTKQELWKRKAHQSPVVSVGLSVDGGYVLTTGEDDGKFTVRLWKASSGEPGPVLGDSEEPFFCETISPDGTLLASGSKDGMLQLWELPSGRKAARLQAHSDVLSSIAFSRNSKLLYTAGYDKIVKVWESASGQEVMALPGHLGFVLSVSASGNDLIASGGMDGTPLVWKPSLAAPRPGNEKGSALWEDLASKDARVAMSAVWRLAQMPTEATALARARIPGPPEEEVLKKILGRLNDDSATVRNQALEELRSVAPDAETQLSSKLKDAGSQETRDAIRTVLEELRATPTTSRELLRRLRALHVLEIVGAREELARIAKAGAGSRQGEDARRTLERLR